MRKTFIAAAASLAIFFTMQSGNAFASTTLTNVVDSVYGTPYRLGGISANSGFDCSGFTKYVYQKMGVTLPRVSTDQYKQGTAVSKSQLKPGDLVFFNTLGNGVSHVGIYIGHGEFAHSSSSKGVRIDSLDNSYYKTRYVGAKRILDQNTYSMYAEA
ncbi:C40 family peptidase [Paenibacillus sp. D2_2]|uniref:C40 family peptidase n=1 Tax=Paenibacillus sp. D2_2 TaxID=3073092 RepID=UPI002814C3F6|nr:C40 family peptidase [Paenibacillus sp. D2_2]WMT41103.1 C40 family peptidase [Paenibacillus sp. D2_2]